MTANRRANAATIAAAIAVSAAVLLGGCGGSSDEQSGSSGKTDDTAVDNGPLSNLFGNNDSPAEARRKQIKQEELVAQCMKEKGWEYTPVDYSQFVSTDGDEDANLSPEEYGKKYFYGVTHNYELYELPSLQGAPGDTAVVPDDGAGAGDQFVDPNADFVQSLSEAEQTQYYEDLSGPQVEPPVNEDGTFTPPPLEQRGCYGIAQLEVFGASPFDNPDISARLDDLYRNLEEDPRLKDAERKWQQCVKDVDPSYEIAGPGDAYSYLDRVKAELSGQEIVPIDPATGEPEGGADNMWSSSINEDGSGWAYLGEPKAITGDKLEQLRTDERKLWETDQKCQKKADMVKIRRAVEQDLADQIVQEFPELDKSGGNG